VNYNVVAFLSAEGILALVLSASVYGRIRARRRARARRLYIVRARLRGGGVPPPVSEGATAKTRSVWSYIEGKLFPAKWWPVKEREQRTFLRTQINVRLGVADRIRLILTGGMRIYVTTYTDVEVRDAESLSNIEVHPF
jgi:hypothetical protein